MEERVPEADEQQLQQMLTDSPWEHQEVMDQVALEADHWLGGTASSCLLIDESGFKKSGKHSVGVARQWCGRLGKVDNCQVGVFAALGRGRRVTLVDERLYLPESWCDDPQRCEQAGIPEAHRSFKTKVALALQMVAHQRGIGVRFAWVGGDGFYGNDPAFLRGLAAMGEVFVADVHCNQWIFLDDPKPTVKRKKGRRGRNPTKLEANAPAIRVDQWQAEQPAAAWQRVKVRDSTCGELEVDVLHRRVWLWDGEETTAPCWHVMVRREINAPEEIKYTLSNAPAATSVQRLAEMQAQRYCPRGSRRSAPRHPARSSPAPRRTSARCCARPDRSAPGPPRDRPSRPTCASCRGCPWGSPSPAPARQLGHDAALRGQHLGNDAGFEFG